MIPGVVVLGHALDLEGGDGHQFAQGFGGGAAVFHSGVQAQQAIDFILLFGAQALVVEESIDGRAEVVSLGQIAFRQAAEELAEVLH